MILNSRYTSVGRCSGLKSVLPKRYVQVLTPGVCERDFIRKQIFVEVTKLGVLE